MPMVLESISDESEYRIDDRQFYSQTFNVKIMAFLITEEDFRVDEVPLKFGVNIDGFKKYIKKPEAEIEECDTESPYYYKPTILTLTYPICKTNKCKFTIDIDFVCEDIQMNNVKNNYKILNNGDKIDKTLPFKFNEGDEIEVIINKRLIDKESRFIMNGYNPSVVYDEYVKKEENIVFNNKDLFFINILRKEIHFVVNAIREQYKHSSHTDTWHEKRVEIDRDGRIKTKVKGFVDKLLVLNNSVIIVDYKTNNTEVNPDLFEFGLSLQLPIYLYLLKELDSNIEVAGMYMQHILDLKSEFDNTKDPLIEKTKRLKLSGITINDIDLISKFDDSCDASEVIQGLRIVKKTGEFSKSKRILSYDDRNELLELVSTLIDNTIENVCDGNFDIRPIKITGHADGCNFCEYKDICFRKYKDFNIQVIKKEQAEGDEE